MMVEDIRFKVDAASVETDEDSEQLKVDRSANNNTINNNKTECEASQRDVRGIADQLANTQLGKGRGRGTFLKDRRAL